MSDKVAAPKEKKIAKAKVGRQVRLWVRAKFLSFRRYPHCHLDQKSPKTWTKPSWDWKESTTDRLLSTTSANAWPTSTKNTPEKQKTALEYIFCHSDHLGKNHNQSRQHWSSACSFCQEPASPRYRFNLESDAVPPKRLISKLFKSYIHLLYPIIIIIKKNRIVCYVDTTYKVRTSE